MFERVASWLEQGEAETKASYVSRVKARLIDSIEAPQSILASQAFLLACQQGYVRDLSPEQVADPLIVSAKLTQSLEIETLDPAPAQWKAQALSLISDLALDTFKLTESVLCQGDRSRILAHATTFPPRIALSYAKKTKQGEWGYLALVSMACELYRSQLRNVCVATLAPAEEYNKKPTQALNEYPELDIVVQAQHLGYGGSPEQFLELCDALVAHLQHLEAKMVQSAKRHFPESTLINEIKSYISGIMIQAWSSHSDDLNSMVATMTEQELEQFCEQRKSAIELDDVWLRYRAISAQRPFIALDAVFVENIEKQTAQTLKQIWKPLHAIYK